MKDESKGCAVLDWQLYCTGSGLYDVANILIGSLTCQDSEEHCIALLKVYQQTLIELGVMDYVDFDRLWKDFRVAILQLGYIFSYWTDTVDHDGQLKPDFPKDALTLFKKFHKRILAAILRYKCTAPDLLL